MADKLGLGPEVRELKLGPTFGNGKCNTAFHTIKYDFKPASVDITKMATVNVGPSNQMTVTVPHLDGAGTPFTVFKGSQKPYQKECVLIIDKVTGEIILERLSSNIQVKKTRCDPKSQLAIPSLHSTARPVTPIESGISPTNGRTVSRTKVASGRKREPSHQLNRPKKSPSRASYIGKSPPTYSSIPSNSSSAMPSSQSSLGSLPMLGENDDFMISLPTPSSTITSSSSSSSQSKPHVTAPPRTMSPIVKEKSFKPMNNLNNDVGVLSDSSSSEESSDSSDSEPEKTSQPNKVNGYTTANAPNALPDVLLNNDLRLSSSETDSD